MEKVGGLLHITRYCVLLFSDTADCTAGPSYTGSNTTMAMQYAVLAGGDCSEPKPASEKADLQFTQSVRVDHSSVWVPVCMN